MSPQQRTPRQKQGDGLVPMLVRVTPRIKALLEAEADAAGVSVAEVARRLLANFFSDTEP